MSERQTNFEAECSFCNETFFHKPTYEIHKKNPPKYCREKRYGK